MMELVLNHKNEIRIKTDTDRINEPRCTVSNINSKGIEVVIPAYGMHLEIRKEGEFYQILVSDDKDDLRSRIRKESTLLYEKE